MTVEQIEMLVRVHTISMTLKGAWGRPPLNEAWMAILDSLVSLGYVEKMIDNEGRWYRITKSGVRYIEESKKQSFDA